MTMQFKEYSMEHFIYDNPQLRHHTSEEFITLYKKWLDELMAERLADAQLDAWVTEQQTQE